LIDKRRPHPNEAKIANLVGDLKNKHVLIIDDMIDTAGTLCNAAEIAMEKGARDILCVATHPVFSGKAIERLQSSPIHKIIVCDTIPIPDEKKFDKLEVISVGAVFGESINRINSGQSLSSMFK